MAGVLGHITPNLVANPFGNLHHGSKGTRFPMQYRLIDEATARSKKIPGRQPQEMEVE
jgi:hypothetical protein